MISQDSSEPQKQVASQQSNAALMIFASQDVNETHVDNASHPHLETHLVGAEMIP